MLPDAAADATAARTDPLAPAPFADAVAVAHSACAFVALPVSAVASLPAAVAVATTATGPIDTLPASAEPDVVADAALGAMLAAAVAVDAVAVAADAPTSTVACGD